MPKIPDRPSNGKTLDGEKKILGKYTNFHFSLVLGGEIYIFLQPLALWHALLLASRWHFFFHFVIWKELLVLCNCRAKLYHDIFAGEMIKCLRYIIRDINWMKCIKVSSCCEFSEFLRFDAIFIFSTLFRRWVKNLYPEKLFIFIFHVFHVYRVYILRIKHKMYIFILLRCSQAPSINYNKLFCLRKTQKNSGKFRKTRGN